jgi:hypothetical protein
MLHKVNWEVPKVWKIQPVQPNHGARAILPMVVVVPCWRDYHVALLHLNAPTVHRSKPAVAFDDEAHCESRVPVGGGSLIRHHELKACI